MNIGNIDKFRNEAVGDFKLMGAGHHLFRGSSSVSLIFVSFALDFAMQGGLMTDLLAVNCFAYLAKRSIIFLNVIR